VVNECVEGFFGAEEVVFVAKVDVVDGLALTDQRRHQLIRVVEFSCGQR